MKEIIKAFCPDCKEIMRIVPVRDLESGVFDVRCDLCQSVTYRIPHSSVPGIVSVPGDKIIVVIIEFDKELEKC